MREILDRGYLDFESNALSVYDKDFRLTLIGWTDKAGRVKQEIDHKKMDLIKEPVTWGNYEFFILKQLGIPFQKFYNLKIPCLLIDENKKWALGEALETIGLLNHKFLKQQWENLGYNWSNVPLKYLKPYNSLDVSCMPKLEDWIKGKYNQRYNQFLQETNQCLCEMSWKGIRLDLECNDKLKAEFEVEIAKHILKLNEISKINWDSDDQVGPILNTIVKLPKTKKGNLATNKKDIDHLRGNKVVDLYLEYKKLKGIYNNFIIGYRKRIDDSAKLHTTYSFAKTGRYRSSNPNLQNLPRTKTSPIKNQIIPDSNTSTFYSLDWKQLELVIAAVAYDIKEMKEDIKKGIDIHQVSADKFGIDRSPWAKNANFAVMYGAGKYSVKQQGLKTNEKGQEFIDWFKGKYPGITIKHAQINQEIAAYKQVTNIHGLTRHTEDFGKGLNFLVQSIAADLNKMMLIGTMKDSLNYRSRPCMDIHDSLIFNVEKEEEKEYLEKVILKNYNSIKDHIEYWFNYKFPLDLRYELERGKNLGEMEKIIV